MTDKIVHKTETETNDGINELSAKVNFGISETEFMSEYNNAYFTICFIVKICDPLIMTTDYIFSVIHATITNFDIIATEELVIFVIYTKMFIQQM